MFYTLEPRGPPKGNKNSTSVFPTSDKLRTKESKNSASVLPTSDQRKNGTSVFPTSGKCKGK